MSKNRAMNVFTIHANTVTVHCRRYGKEWEHGDSGWGHGDSGRVHGGLGDMAPREHGDADMARRVDGDYHSYKVILNSLHNLWEGSVICDVTMCHAVVKRLRVENMHPMETVFIQYYTNSVILGIMYYFTCLFCCLLLFKCTLKMK